MTNTNCVFSVLYQTLPWVHQLRPLEHEQVLGVAEIEQVHMVSGNEASTPDGGNRPGLNLGP